MWRAQQQADISWLFTSQALRIAPADTPFWYTSGLIGPYYINTHFVCGGEQRAQTLLSEIDVRSGDAASFPSWILAELKAVYHEHEIYRQVIDTLAALAEEALPLDEITHISGGERRDWFFSPLLAERLKKECLYIFNDLSLRDHNGRPISKLPDAKVLNVADLLTVGSSYTTKWIPAMENVRAKLLCALHVVDRCQGGEESLRESGVLATPAIFRIDVGLFDEALKRELIDAEQHTIISRYLADPFTAMRDFLITHKEFLQQALESDDPKTRSRAALLTEGNLYKLD